MPPEVSVNRLIGCQFSAQFWAANLPGYGARMQTLADRYTIAASLISTVTGLAAWGTITTSAGAWGEALVGGMAFVAAAVAIIPKYKNYGDCAVKASLISKDYGEVLGRLADVIVAMSSRKPGSHAEAVRIVEQFEAIRARKQDLRPFPADLEAQLHAMRPPAAVEEPGPEVEEGKSPPGTESGIPPLPDVPVPAPADPVPVA